MQLREEIDGEDLRIVALSVDLAAPALVDTVEGIVAFAEKRGFDTLELVLFDGEIEALNDTLDLPGPLPFTFALDRRGQRVDTIEEAANPERFREMARRALEAGSGD